MQNNNKKTTRMPEDLLPNSIEAEEALIGSVLINPEAYVLVSDFLKAEDFYRSTYQQVWDVVEYLVEREEIPDLVSISDELDHRKVHLGDQTNGFYLTELMNRVPTSNNAEMYGRMIEDRAVRRRLLQAAGMIATTAQQDSAEEALANAEEQLFAIAQKRSVSSYTPISDIIANCTDLMNQARENKSQFIGLPTMFTDLDLLLKGLRKKALYILAARPRVGKTSLLLALAYHIAVYQKKRVVIFSLEMGKEELTFRLISQIAGVSSNDLQLGNVEDEDWDRVVHAMSVVSESGMVIDETGGLSVAQLRSRCRQIQAKGGLDIVFVDYLQLLSASRQDGRSYNNRVDEIGDVSRKLKSLAKELDVPVFALAQLSRAVEQRGDKIPQLSDLRESGSIEQDSDCVMFIHREALYNPNTERQNEADIIIAKNRGGSEGEVTLAWNGKYTRFANLEVKPADEEN
jgi:replicative DNA helicase